MVGIHQRGHQLEGIEHNGRRYFYTYSFFNINLGIVTSPEMWGLMENLNVAILQNGSYSYNGMIIAIVDGLKNNILEVR